MLIITKIYNYNALEGLKHLQDESVDCCIISPPYWGLRDYGVQGQLGLESTPELYVEKITTIFNEVNRVLKKEIHYGSILAIVMQEAKMGLFTHVELTKK